MAIQGLRTKYNGEFDASKLFKELDQIGPAETHWTFTSPAAMIGIALAIFLIGMLIWMFRQTKFYRGTISSTFGTPYAISQSTTETPHSTSNQQSGHQIKCVYPYSYQNLMKKLPEERERYWNNIRSDINDEF
jgi:hypothetical protein